jgi:hypothetical protein
MFRRAKVYIFSERCVFDAVAFVLEFRGMRTDPHSVLLGLEQTHLCHLNA